MRLALSGLLVCALAAPAAAAPDPNVAEGISALAPLGFGTTCALVTLLQGQSVSNLPLYFFAGTALGIGTVGLGHGYGGDPWRGAAVGGGAYLATGLGTGLGAIALLPLMPHTGGGLGDLAQQLLYGAMIGGSAAMLGYGWWAAQDAKATTSRVNAERKP